MRLDPAHLPGPPQDDEEQYRQSDADRQRAHHAPRLALVVVDEVHHGRDEAQDDREKDEQDQPLHARHRSSPQLWMREYIPVLNLRRSRFAPRPGPTLATAAA